jgi:hypothetical protein
MSRVLCSDTFQDLLPYERLEWYITQTVYWKFIYNSESLVRSRVLSISSTKFYSSNHVQGFSLRMEVMINKTSELLYDSL